MKGGSDIEGPSGLNAHTELTSHTDNLDNKVKQGKANGPAGTKLDIQPLPVNKGKPVINTINEVKIGGASSAWRSSVYSRGPSNYPDNGWYNGKTQFNQFTKTGDYIKNTDLPYAAAPISTGAIPDPDNMKGFNSKWGNQFAKFGGSKKKKISKKKKATRKKK